MDVSKWKLADVVAWLQRVELGQYVEVFTKEEVDGPALLKLEKDTLKEKLKVEEKDIESFTGCIRDLRQQTDLAKQMEEYMCHICMELLFDPVTAKCGHTFCKHCLQTWLAKSTTCPVDREQLPKEVPSTAVHLRDLLASRFVDHYIDRSQSHEAKVQKAAEEHQRKLEEAEKQTRIKALKRHFNAGFQLDDSVLEAVLEMCENNVEQAKTYLELTGQEPAHFIPVEELANEGVRVPRDYAADPIAYPPLKIEEKPSLVAALVNAFIGSDSTYTLHMQLQRDHYALYVRVLKLLLARGVEMNHGAKSRVLAVCWMRRDWDLSEFLFGTEANGLLSEIPARADTFGVPEVLKALKLLDSNRQIRAKEKKLARLQALPKVKNKKVGVVVSELNDLKREPIPVGSLSGALIRHVRKIILRIPRQKLEFFALQLPTEPWKELADLLHLHSENSLCISWFMKRVFGAEPPADSIVAACANLDHANSLDLLKKHQPPYSFVRCKIPDLTEEEKDVISKYISVDTCIWWHEDLQSPSVNALLAQRLRGEEVVSLNYGKLMERLLYFKQQGQDADGIFKELLPLAEQKLRQLSLQLQSPVVVLGDASFSMDVAIRVSVIMSSIVAALSNAELRFFNSVSVKPPVVPQTASDVLEIARSTRADGQTAPAAALWEYYEQKKRVNVFVVVSDERENLKFNGMYFPQLFYKYCKEVHPAQLVLISFLEANAKGQMATALEKMGIKPIQYSLDSRRPDLTKLDGLIAQLSTHTEAFVEAIQKPDQAAVPQKKE